MLAVDLDGTLIRTDMLAETFAAALSSQPLKALAGLAALPQGRAAVKRRLAEATDVDPALLPYNDDVIDLIEEWRANGGRTALVTASDQGVADRIAAHLGIFDEVHGSHPGRNLKGADKAAFLVERFGARGYAYAGDSKADLPVWAQAAKAITVGANDSLRDKAAGLAPEAEHIASGSHVARALLRAMRPHQWLKNVLVFLPIIAAHDLSATSIGLGLLAFVAFSLTASSVYLLNDVLDLSADRVHARKRHRPFASGALPLFAGGAAIPLLLLLGFGVGAAIGPWFVVVLAGYFSTTLAYSFFLKRRAIIDICVLAGLYTARIIAGAVAAGLDLSVWFLAFSIFLFLCLAAVKRQAELVHLKNANGDEAAGRGYVVEDIPIVASMAIAAGYAAVVVLALYLNTDAVQLLYGWPEALWGVCCVIIYWVSRTAMLAHRGRMPDDPLIYAVTDRVSLLCGILAAVCFVIAMQ